MFIPLSNQFNDNAVEMDLKRRMRFRYANGQFNNARYKCPGCDTPGQCFDQLEGRSFHDFLGYGMEFRVVNGVLQLIAESRSFQIQLENQSLRRTAAQLVLLRKNAMIPEKPHAIKCQLIHLGFIHSFPALRLLAVNHRIHHLRGTLDGGHIMNANDLAALSNAQCGSGRRAFDQPIDRQPQRVADEPFAGGAQQHRVAQRCDIRQPKRARAYAAMEPSATMSTTELQVTTTELTK